MDHVVHFSSVLVIVPTHPQDTSASKASTVPRRSSRRYRAGYFYYSHAFFRGSPRPLPPHRTVFADQPSNAHRLGITRDGANHGDPFCLELL